MSHKARKKFGQNFLVDAQIIANIIQCIQPKADDHMVEIGPGLGAMTRPLLKHVKKLHVIEIDRDLIARLEHDYPQNNLPQNNLPQNHYSATGATAALPSHAPPIIHPPLIIHPRLIIHSGDALEFDFATLPAPLRIVGNLPYNISSPLLFHFAEYAERIQDMHFMLQDEVVERMVAASSTPAYGRLSVMLQYRFRMEKLMDVPPASFRPAPAVNSAIVCMIPLPPSEILVQDEILFAQIVAAAFGQRRKTLRNTLKNYLTEAGLEQLKINPQLRAENLGVKEFARIAAFVKNTSTITPKK